MTRLLYNVHLTNGLRSPKYDKYVSSRYMYRKSFLHPTKITGVSGQNLRISGYHMARQFRNDTGFVMEKHKSTTSERPYAKRRSFSWSPNVSQSRSDTFTLSTTSQDRSRTCFQIVLFRTVLPIRWNDWSYILVDSVLVDSPNGGHVRGQ